MALTEAEVAALKKSALAVMCRDRHRLLVRFPFTGALLMRMELVPTRDRRLRTAATDGTRIFMDVAFCAGLSEAEQLFVLAHEMWHGVYLHMLRCQTRDPSAFNVATDMEVNRMLKKEGFETPKWCLQPRPSWTDLSAEEIYEQLRKNPPQPKPFPSEDGRQEQFDKHVYSGRAVNAETDAEGGEEEGDGRGASDQWGEVGSDPDFAPSVADNLAEKMREHVVAVAQQIERTRGTLSAHLENVVKAALKPQIRWQEVLAQFVTSCYGGSRRWLPPNRRHVAQGLYLPSSRKERLRAVVAVDTSGSTTNDLPQFFSELGSLLETFGDYELTVIQCDSKVQDVERYYDAYDRFHSPEWKTCGGGGTDFRPPFDYVAEHPEIEPSCLVYVTDGFGPAPDRPPPYPVLWILTHDGRTPAPWGLTLRLKENA